jgi:hypothetical protein
MPKRVEPKSEVVFRVANPREHPYLLTDGNGLALRVWPDGSKTWLLRYRRPGTGKENFLSLGPYPDITLVDARRSATTARNLVREGIDPVVYRQAESIARKRVAEGAFHLVAQRWLDFKHKEWADETYRKAEFVVREYLTPALRNKPISTLATPEVKAVLAHAKRGDAQKAYDRTTFDDDRRRVMQEWADYLGRLCMPTTAAGSSKRT